MSSPTQRQLEVLRAIDNAVHRDGWAPTVRELRDALDVSSTKAVADHLTALVKKDLLVKGNGSRALRITVLGHRYLRGAA